MGLHFLAGLIALAVFSGQVAAPTQPPSTDPALRCPMDQPYEEDNPFARILRGEIPRSRVYEDEQVIVILPLEWDHPGHALVVPKRPVRSLLDMTSSEMAHALNVARQVGLAQQRALGSTGFTLVQNNGRSQHVCHVHFHVIPNTPRATQDPVPREDLDRMAERLQAMFPRDWTQV